VSPENREKCYARTRAVLNTNNKIMREWWTALVILLEWREQDAGAIALVKYHANIRQWSCAKEFGCGRAR